MVWTGLAGTLLIHAAGVLLLLVSVASRPKSGPPTFAVELVAAPRLSSPARSAESRSSPVTPAPPVAKSKPKPAPSRTEPATKARVSRTPSQVQPLPDETPGTGSDIANVKLAGKEFPYPEYLRNLVAQIYRRWNRPVGNAALSTEVAFVILRDGTVKDIAVVTPSPSYSFNVSARGAIDAAAAVKAFGPLPTGYPADYLQINFIFEPRRAP